MAKAGFWLRGARGKIAGASAQKGQNGTILREIVTPRNPKTDKQIYQRAIMATVMKAYSAGKQIFDHAFQGVEKGQKSQQYFISKNAGLLRSLIADDINKIAAGTLRVTEAQNCCVAPKALYAVPNAYMISEGTYDQNFITADDGGNFQFPVGSIEQDNTGPDADQMYKTTLKDYAAATGLIPGDIYTIVMIARGNNIVFNGVDQTGQESNLLATKQYNSVFAYVRLQVKSDILTNTTIISGESEDEAILLVAPACFDVTAAVHPELFGWTGESAMTGIPAYIQEGVAGSFGFIRSRIDEDLRSTSFMQLTGIDMDTPQQYGITSPYVLPTWKKGTDTLGTSEKILESDENSGFVSA